MELCVKTLVFLWWINFIPPFISIIFGNRWNTPLDFRKTFIDDKPILGSHKTIRGFCGAILIGTISSPLLGWSYSNGFIVVLLSMVGDILTSFIKRRLNKPEGTVMAGLDQLFEGLFPILFVHRTYDLSLLTSALCLILFSIGAYSGSIFYKRILLTPPVHPYPRSVNPKLRLREWKACQIQNDPLRFILNFEDAVCYSLLLQGMLKILGIYSHGVRNALDIQYREIEFLFEDLPNPFDSYTILFLTDLHINSHKGLVEKIIESLSAIDVCDICLLGGDYRMEEVGHYHSPFEGLKKIVPYLFEKSRQGIIAILGNHDCIEMVNWFESHNVRVLVNESFAIERQNERIYIVGVDDPHYFRCHDLDEAFKEVPKGSFSILLAHSPEVYREAEKKGTRLYLCGHTHAGQIQLPKIGPLFTHSKTGRRFFYGKWRFRAMEGYTSSGVGASGIFTRFGTKGEIVKITLRRGKEDHGKGF